MPNAALSDAEIQQCKNLLGYPNVLLQANPIIGTSRVFEDILQKYADDYGIGYIRNTILVNITQLETELQATRSRFKVSQAEEFTQNPDEMRKYKQLREFWIKRLEQTTGIKRYRGPGGRSGGDVF
jgi:hypothetical protein